MSTQKAKFPDTIKLSGEKANRIRIFLILPQGKDSDKITKHIWVTHTREE